MQNVSWLLWNNTEAFGMLTWNAQNIWCFWKRRYFWKKPLSRSLFIRKSNMNYFKTGKLVYPGAWRALLKGHKAKTSPFLCSLKYFWNVFLMLSIVASSYSNGTKSFGPSREYFTVVGFGSVLSLCTNSSIILVSLTLFFHDLKTHKKLIEFEIVLKTFVVFIFCSKILTRYIKIHGPQPPRPSYFFTLILLE